MKNILKYAITAAAAGMLFVSPERAADADQKFNCAMKGRWVEAAEDWEFNADYTYRDGSDQFTGIFVNPKAGATANVTGNATAGKWTIALNYTDSGHQGWQKVLTGTGLKDKVTHILTVTGNFVLTKPGAGPAAGTFKLVGTCKAR